MRTTVRAIYSSYASTAFDKRTDVILKRKHLRRKRCERGAERGERRDRQQEEEEETHTKRAAFPPRVLPLAAMVTLRILLDVCVRRWGSVCHRGHTLHQTTAGHAAAAAAAGGTQRHLAGE